MKVLVSCVCVVFLLTVGVKRVAAAGPPPAIDGALRAAAARYGVPYWELRAVSYCESTWRADPPHNNPSRGLFQFLWSTWQRTPYASYSVYNAWANAMAAAWLVRRDGGWKEWSCQP